ncbi:hypothetical protein V500_04612 [Pseudogymnoascus sp. VKM F-4518 (FW-2643)]|nr:hypothetical protein V500_04612 [Pseudogymnoascus sp. VKM F-4518 (FW-2643)]
MRHLPCQRHDDDGQIIELLWKQRLSTPNTTAIMDMDKLKKMQHGKGTPRRKVKSKPKNSGVDDKKLQTALKKINVQPIQAIEEVNMFKADGNVIHFAAPKVHAAVPSNTFAIYGNGEDKELTELVPGILNQLGPDSLASLRKLAESYQSMQKKEGEEKEDDDDIPDLVAGETFDEKVDVEINPNLHLPITDKSDANMAQPLSRSATPPFFNMRSATPMHNGIARRMNQASGNATTEAPEGRHAEYWPHHLYVNHSPSASPQGPSQIPGPYVSAAEAWEPARTPAHSSHAFMSARIPEQTHLLEGLAAIEARLATAAPVNAAGSSNLTTNATGAEPGTNIKWAFSERNFRKLLKKCIAYRENLVSSRWTTKKYIEEDIQSTARIQDLEEHIRFLKVTIGELNDERQRHRVELTALQNKLRRKDRLISRLLNRLTGRIHRFAGRN